MSGPELFVVCKHCQAEVSPYITECPYCGKRLRKRAQLDSPRRAATRRRSPTAIRLGALRADEIPGIRPDHRPYASIALVMASVVTTLLPVAGVFAAERGIVVHPLGGEWWRLLSGNFIYGDIYHSFPNSSAFANTVYLFVALAIVAIFGSGLERRHGPVVVLLVFLVGGAAGMAVATELGGPDLAVGGGNAGGLALLCAWAVPDLLARRRGEDPDSDGLGLIALAALLLAMPLATDVADPLAGVTGGLVGLLLGLPLARLGRASRVGRGSRS
ncbi:MAG: rhomboid family intramembrane serine protease [Solirubrobacteraceae bacterium]